MTEEIKSLTEEQKLLILNEFNKDAENPPSQKVLCELCFGPGVDGRDKRAKLIKEYCATLGFKPRSAFEYVHKKGGDLTEEQKNYITNHASTMSPTEMAREIFPEIQINSRCLEVRKIVEYLKTLSNVILFQPLNEMAEGDYVPPKTLNQAAARVNKYIQNGIKPEDIEKEQKIKLNLNCLIRYCHNPRFQLKMNGLTNNTHRALFEQGYVRFLYDKGEDITEEEIDAYINLCDLITEEQIMTEEIQKLTQLMDDILKDNDNKKLSMTFVEGIDNIRDKLSQNRKMQDSLRNNLQGKRSERIETKKKNNQSFLQAIEAWRDKTKRERLLKLADMRKQAVQQEIKKLENLDAYKAELFGLNPDV